MFLCCNSSLKPVKFSVTHPAVCVLQIDCCWRIVCLTHNSLSCNNFIFLTHIDIGAQFCVVLKIVHFVKYNRSTLKVLKRGVGRMA